MALSLVRSLVRRGKVRDRAKTINVDRARALGKASCWEGVEGRRGLLLRMSSRANEFQGEAERRG